MNLSSSVHHVGVVVEHRRSNLHLLLAAFALAVAFATTRTVFVAVAGSLLSVIICNKKKIIIFIKKNYEIKLKSNLDQLISSNITLIFLHIDFCRLSKFPNHREFSRFSAAFAQFFPLIFQRRIPLYRLAKLALINSHAPLGALAQFTVLYKICTQHRVRCFAHGTNTAHYFTHSNFYYFLMSTFMSICCRLCDRMTSY